jgi:predicted RNA methylase
MQDTGKFRVNGKDQFYTQPAIAEACISSLIAHYPDAATDYTWIEPSAGAGAFVRAFPAGAETVAIDIEPAAADIVKADFLEWLPESVEPCVALPSAGSTTPQSSKKYLVVGNPPFGRQSSLAKAFIRKAATFATLIAFILPKSFVKPSMSAAFPGAFHCKHSEELAKDSFVINGQPYDVPCVFQIWERCDEKRAVVEKVEPVGFTYVKGNEEYDIAFRRVGGLAGRCYKAGSGSFSVQSHYFLKVADESKINTIIEKVNAHQFPSNTVGPRSIAKGEANTVLNEVIRTV